MFNAICALCLPCSTIRKGQFLRKFKMVNPFFDLTKNTNYCGIVSRIFCSRSELKARYLLVKTLLFAIVFHFYLQLVFSFVCNCFSLAKLQFWAKSLTWHDVSLGCPKSEDGEDPSCPPPPHHSFLGKKICS